MIIILLLQHQPIANNQVDFTLKRQYTKFIHQAQGKGVELYSYIHTLSRTSSITTATCQYVGFLVVRRHVNHHEYTAACMLGIHLKLQ